MFTWICPDCGREVPPSYTECPDCIEKRKSRAATVADESAKAPAPAPIVPAPSPYLRLPELAPPPPPARQGMPTWLMSIVFALAFGGVVAGAYLGVQYLKKEPASAQTASAPATEAPTPVSSTGPNPLLKQIEIAGLRLTQNKDQKTEVRFLVVNHSGAEIPDLAATINLQGRTKKDEEPVGSFSFRIPVLAPYESKEVTTLVDTRLKVYELPDWQNLDPRIQITSPNQ